MTFESVLTQARAEGRSLLNEVEAKQLLAGAGIPVVNTVLATTPEEARAQAEQIGYPIVLKIVSPEIAHKSDVGGVRIGLEDGQAVTSAFEEIVSNAKQAVPGASITGVAVQNMAPAGTEVIVGMTTDPHFGPVIMFGLGGIMVEVLKDVSFRVVPLTERDAAQMIGEIKGSKMLDGVRGQPQSDKQALCKAILNVAEFVQQHPEVQELDLNPMLVYADGAIAVDARIVLASG
ncbi:MAG TPA: acetyl-CoA synthetase [Gammaproteobacteria bacterium]|nr:acetyl-CoA synthetase [Gammaproteobacteria bacterium]HIL99181.1 acetyl-CoA synthetase [Pseudomonadales bacterium]